MSVRLPDIDTIERAWLPLHDRDVGGGTDLVELTAAAVGVLTAETGRAVAVDVVGVGAAVCRPVASGVWIGVIVAADDGVTVVVGTAPSNRTRVTTGASCGADNPPKNETVSATLLPSVSGLHRKRSCSRCCVAALPDRTVDSVDPGAPDTVTLTVRADTATATPSPRLSTLVFAGGIDARAVA